MRKNNIPTPCKKEVDKYLDRWNNVEELLRTTNKKDDLFKTLQDIEKYRRQEESLMKLFTKTYNKNDDLNNILIKVSCLNDFYSTNIFSTYPVAVNIKNIDFDLRIKKFDPKLVDDIALNEYDDKKKRFYSFATKYCAHHNGEYYPIYDSYVDKMLRYFRNMNKKEFNFYNDDLKDYNEFVNILKKFMEVYGLEDYKLREIDLYLWQAGKEYFNR